MHARENPTYKSPVVAAQAPPRAIAGLGALAPAYDSLFCDIWGVVHDGRKPFAAALAALAAFRRQGGRVVLLSNAPRPGREVAGQLRAMGVNAAHFDHIITSGDCCRTALAEGAFGARMGHLGPARDLPLFDGLGLARIPLMRARHILCTGLMDDHRETAETYLPLLRSLRAREGRFLCANPDLVVMRGSRQVPCAGALAQLYAELGGEVVQFGKPYAPIYAAARACLPPQAKILIIGDGMETDIAGAAGQGLDSVFIIGGIAQAALGDHPSGEAVAALAPQGKTPMAYMPALSW